MKEGLPELLEDLGSPGSLEPASLVPWFLASVSGLHLAYFPKALPHPCWTSQLIFMRVWSWQQKEGVETMNNQVIIQWGDQGGQEDENRSPSNPGTRVSIVAIQAPGWVSRQDCPRPKYSLELLCSFCWSGSLVLLVCLCLYLVKYQEGPQRCLVTPCTSCAVLGM